MTMRPTMDNSFNFWANELFSRCKFSRFSQTTERDDIVDTMIKGRVLMFNTYE